MKHRKFSSMTARARTRTLAAVLLLLGTSGCALVRPAPLALPPQALAILQQPVVAKVTLIDDAGNEQTAKATIPAGWSVMYLAPQGAGK